MLSCRASFSFLFFIFFRLALLSQNNNAGSVGETVMRNHAFNAGIFTDGWGLGYEYQFGKMTQTKKLIGIEFTERKHNKEKKTDFRNNAFGDFSVAYGKQNICYPLHFYFGNSLNLGGPNQEQGITINIFYKGGLSLAFIRPYYITLSDTSSIRNPQKTVNVKYTPIDSLFFFNPNYYAGSPYFLGLNELKVILGAHFGGGIEFEFGHLSQNMLIGFRASANVEWYGKTLDIMVPKENLINDQFFLSGKLSLYIGSKNTKQKFFKTH